MRRDEGSLYSSVVSLMKEVYQLHPGLPHGAMPDRVVSLEEKAGGAHDAQNRSPCRWNRMVGGS
jgi:hypothetical protein